MLFLPLFAAAIGLAQPTLEECRSIAEPTERLACYDSITSSAPAATTDPAQLAAPISEEQRRAQFEQTAKQIKEGGPIPAIVSAPVEIEEMANGSLRITLENGQVWRQLSSDRAYRISKKAPPEMATITAGAMGSYRLKFDGNRQSLRVRREK